jgi:hypothetical protein
MGATFADNPGGETLPSDEVAVNVGAGGTVSLTWTSVPGADHYRVYRSPGPDGASGSEVLIEARVTSTSYVDSGASAGTDVPLVIGSTGAWVVQSTALLHPRLDAAGAVGPDGAGGSRVYLAGGWGACSGTTNAVMGCAESTTIDVAGDALGSAFVETGIPAVSGPDAGVGAFQPRMRHGLAVLTAANGPSGTPADAAFLVLAGGYGPYITSGRVEIAPIVSGSSGVGPWQPANNTAPEIRDGTQLAVVNGVGYLFMGGTAPAQYKSTGFLSTLTSVSTAVPTFSSWSSNGTSLPGGATLGRFGLTVDGVYFYVVGGTSNDAAEALSSVYQVFE